MSLLRTMRQVLNVLAVGVLPGVWGCTFGFVPVVTPDVSLSTLPEGVHLEINGEPIDEKSLGVLKPSIDHMPGSPPTMALYNEPTGLLKDEEIYSIFISFDRKFGLDFPSSFDHGSLEAARFDFHHPNETDDGTAQPSGRGSRSQIEGIPPGGNRGLVGPLAGRTTVFLLKVENGRMYGVFAAPFEFPRSTGGSGRTYDVKLKFNAPYQPEFTS